VDVFLFTFVVMGEKRRDSALEAPEGVPAGKDLLEAEKVIAIVC
jgi:hypothetical protein